MEKSSGKSRTGRPAKADADRRRRQPRPLYILLTPAEREQLDAWAARETQPLSAIARDVLLRAARRAR